MLDPCDTDRAKHLLGQINVSTSCGTIRFRPTERWFVDVRNRYLHHCVSINGGGIQCLEPIVDDSTYMHERRLLVGQRQMVDRHPAAPGLKLQSAPPSQAH